MHRTNSRPLAFRWAVFLALLLSSGAAVERAAADGPCPPPYHVQVNGTREVPVPENRLAREIKVHNPGVVRVNPSANAKAVVITGLIPGLTKVEVTDDLGRVSII